MKVTREFKDNKLHYHMLWSREDFDWLCQGEEVFGDSPGGFRFHIYPWPSEEISAAFKPHPSDWPGGFYIYFGHPMPKLPPNATAEQFQNFSDEAYKMAEVALKSSGKIPIIEPMPPPLENAILGYVTMHLEDRC